MSLLDQVFLTPDVEAPSVFDAVEALGFQAIAFTNHDSDDRRVELSNPIANIAALADMAGDPTWFSFEFRRGDNQLRFVKNGRIDVSHFESVGPDAAAIRLEIESRLPHFDRARLYERATSGAPSDRLDALLQLAIARGPVPEPHVLRLVRDSLAHEERLVRRTAVLACAYFEWRDTIPMLEALIAREHEPTVLDDAKICIAGVRNVRADAIGRFTTFTIEHGPHTETIWVRPATSFVRDWDADRYLVSSIPHTIENLALPDTIVPGPSPIVARSGHRTLHLASTAEAEAVLIQHALRFEEQLPGRLAVDVPPTIDLDAVRRALT